MDDFPAALDAWSQNNSKIYNAGALISTHNEENIHVSAGYARVPIDLVDWVLVFEQGVNEVYGPVNQFRNVIIACIFGVVTAILVGCFPIAHCVFRPIRELRAAAQKAVASYEVSRPSMDDDESLTLQGTNGIDEKTNLDEHGRPIVRRQKTQNFVKQRFHIPQRVPERHHIIYNELSDLTETFNAMSDELRSNTHA